MPAITSGKVLVTGATGFVAQWAIHQLLQRGFVVRGTVRSEAKGASLKGVFAEYGNKFEFSLVEDMTADGAYDDTVRGVNGILHIASAICSTDDPDEISRSTIKGAVNILESALKYGDAVKRVVFTSSCACVYSRALPEYREYSEKDWNTESLEEVETKGRDATLSNKYRAGKIRAERAAWQFIEEHRDQLKFDLVVLNPPAIFGPSLQFTARTLDELTGAMKAWVNMVVRGRGFDRLLESGEWVDVRDAALAHVLALQNEEVAGQRIIVTAGEFNFQEFVSIAHELHDKIPVGDTSFDPANPAYTIRCDATKAAKYFGIQYRSKEETTKDTLEQLEKNKLLPWI